MANDDPDGKGTGIAEKFSQIAKDLINIEVNTIVQRSITAQKMPEPRHALIDLGKEYHTELETIMGQFRVSAHYGNANGQPIVEPEDEAVAGPSAYVTAKTAFEKIGGNQFYGGFTAFDAYRNLAKFFIANHPDQNDYVTPRQRSILPRIKDNSDLIKGMMSALFSRELIKIGAEHGDPKIEDTPNFVVDLCRDSYKEETEGLDNEFSRTDLVTGGIGKKRIEPLALSEGELVFLRKAWELGTAVVAMQTVIQIDGDVISRLNPLMLDEDFAQLNDYHRAGVNISLQHWSDLVNVAKELVVAVVRGIGGG
jgi:hypothetical protein